MNSFSMVLQGTPACCHKCSGRVPTIVSVVSCAINVVCMAVIFSRVYSQGSEGKQVPQDIAATNVQLHSSFHDQDIDSINNRINVAENVLDRFARGTDRVRVKNRDRKCKCRRGKRGPRGKAAKTLRSAHYLSNFQDHEKQKFSVVGIERCVKMESEVLVCRNRTVSLQKPATNYKFLHAASWMKETRSPIFKDQFGAFNVLQSGIYLVYSTTNFYDAKIKLYQVIKVNGNGKLWCMDGVDFVAESKYSENVRLKTCSVTGIMQLNKGDKVEIQNLNPNLTIDITKDRTFFGVVLLHSER